MPEEHKQGRETQTASQWPCAHCSRRVCSGTGQAVLLGSSPESMKGTSFSFFFNVDCLRLAQTVEYLPAVQESRVPSLGREDPLEKEMATHSSILAWRSPWTEEPDGLQSTRSRRVRHNPVTCTSLWYGPLLVFVEFVTVLFLFYVCLSYLVSWPQGKWGLSSLTRDRTHTPALEGEVLTIEPPGKPWASILSCYELEYTRDLGNELKAVFFRPLTRVALGLLWCWKWYVS